MNNVEETKMRNLESWAYENSPYTGLSRFIHVQLARLTDLGGGSMYRGDSILSNNAPGYLPEPSPLVAATGGDPLDVNEWLRSARDSRYVEFEPRGDGWLDVRFLIPPHIPAEWRGQPLLHSERVALARLDPTLGRDIAHLLHPCVDCGAVSQTHANQSCDPCSEVIREQHVETRRAMMNLPREMREWFLDRDGRRCVIAGCTSTNLALDHITAVSKGGLTVPDNIQVMCQPHNSSKHNKDFQEWLRLTGLHIRTECVR